MPSPRRIPATIAYFASFAGLGLVYATLGPTLPGLALNTSSTLRQISYLFTARSLGYMSGSFLAGRLYDRLPGHPIMALVLLVMSGMMALVPVMPVLGLLAAVVLVLGVAQGTLDVGGNTLIVWVHREGVGPFMNALHFFFGVGALVTPIIVAQAITRTGGISWAYWVVALVLLPIAFGVGRLPSPEHLSIGASERPNQGDARTVLLVAGFLFLYVGAEVAFGGWIYTYGVRTALADEASAAYLTSAYWATFTIGRLLAIPISARFRPRTMLAGNLAGCFLSLGIIAAWPQSPLALWIGSLGLGLSFASMFPTTINFAGKRILITGRVTSWFLVGASMGGMTLPWIVGQFFERVGPIVLITIIAVDLVAAAGAFVVLMLRAGGAAEKADTVLAETHG